MGANVLKCCSLDYLIYFPDNGVMTTPKRRILSFVFTVLCFRKSLLSENLSKINGKNIKSQFNFVQIVIIMS